MSAYPIDFGLKSGDLLPSIPATLYVGAAVLDLTGCTVRFVMRELGGAVVIDQPASIIGAPTLGQVRYDWQAGNTDRVGLYIVEWHVTRPDAKTLTVPSLGYSYVQIDRRINA